MQQCWTYFDPLHPCVDCSPLQSVASGFLAWSPYIGVGKGILSRSGDSVRSAGSVGLSKEVDSLR